MLCKDDACHASHNRKKVYEIIAKTTQIPASATTTKGPTTRKTKQHNSKSNSNSKQNLNSSHRKEELVGEGQCSAAGVEATAAVGSEAEHVAVVPLLLMPPAYLVQSNQVRAKTPEGHSDSVA